MVIDSWTVWTRFDFYDFFNRRAPYGAIAGEWVNFPEHKANYTAGCKELFAQVIMT